MFENKKKLNQIEEEKQKLELEKSELLTLKEQIEKEKSELLFIKEQLEDCRPKIDVSDIYVWEDKGLYSIVKLEVEKIEGKNCMGEYIKGYSSVLTDIFTNKVVYQKKSAELINSREAMQLNWYSSPYYAKFFPLYGADKNLLAYTDKKVPLYVIQQLYYRLNNVDVNAYVLKKDK